MRRSANAINMTDLTVRTPASQYAYQLIQSGEIGEVTGFRGEH
jgi:predicted dehydrogenase